VDDTDGLRIFRFTMLGSPQIQGDEMATYDTIIAGGMVIDGTRAQRLRADV